MQTHSAEACHRRGALPGAILLLPTHEQIPSLEVKRHSEKLLKSQQLLFSIQVNLI